MDTDKIDEAAMPLVEQNEGCVLHAYKDVGGVWTQGWGSTRDFNGFPVTQDTPIITQEQANFMLKRDLGNAVHQVLAAVKVPMSYNEAAALVDFVYNLGIGNLERSTLLKLLNEGQYSAAADQILLWDKDNGVTLAGLLRRRQQERQEFLKPDNTVLDTPTS